MINVKGLKLNSIDYIFIVDREFTVIYNTRYDKRLNIFKDEFEKSEYINKNFFEIYPTIKKETSSIVKCMATGEIIVNKYQKFKDIKGKIYCTHNITAPLVVKGKIMGVVEFVKDVTTVDNIDNTFEDDFWQNTAKIDDYFKITFNDFLTQNKSMLRVIENAKIFAKTLNPTLIYGETGTGKEILIQAMISYSGIPKNKVIVQNCAAVPENLIESILFGTSKGAYTGAENHKGLFEEADGGILFLDEINSMPYQVQGKLLRVLQDGSFRSIGSNTEKVVNTKVIAAMNIDPIEAVEKNILRRDLFYRFSSSMLFLIPLRERKEDIMLLINYYINEFNKIYNKNTSKMTKRLEKFFYEYKWEGNVRELKHVIESMICIAEDEILDTHQLPAYMYGFIDKCDKTYNTEQSFNKSKDIIKKDSEIEAEITEYNLNKILEKTEEELIRKVLTMTDGNKTKAGEILGIPRQTLKYKMNKLNIKY